MLASSIIRKAKGSSARWLERQTRDPFVRKRTDSGESYRSRSAFKLVSLTAKYPDLLAPGKAVVDLGAAPGGWTQVAASRAKGAPVIAVDLLRMAPVPGAHAIQADFLDIETQRYIAEQVGGEQMIDTVLSDMMAPMSGVRTRDVQASLDLVGAATEFARATLKVGRGMGETVAGKKRYDGGSLVMKFFAHPDMDHFKRDELDGWFAKVVVDKPKESRSESSEAYFVCLGYTGPPLNRQ